jgi:hypothetical protein
MENANSSMHANQLINALFHLVMQLMDANQLQETVMITMHVPLIAAIQLSDVSTLQSLATAKMLATFLTAAHSRDANPNQRIVMTKTHAPRIVVLTDNV